MSVIVKDMRMPKTCMDCPLADGEYGWCDVDNSVEMCNDERPDDCPLVALPDKHGDLIDKDEFKETLDYYIREAGWSDEHNEALTWVKDDFIDAETIIVGAEGEG